MTSKEWFGGGIDVTPSFNNPGDKIYMEKLLKNVCFRNKKNYKKYKRWCDKYFYLPHHNETRGIGGIFSIIKRRLEKNFQFIRDVGICFIELSKNLIMRNYMTKTNGNDKKTIVERGKYIEFNLLYDRGTKFGLNSGGNLDSILMSIPPKASGIKMEKEPITINGLKKLKEELEILRISKDQKLLPQLLRQGHGDLKENAEYHAAKEQQAQLEGRVVSINDIIARANVIDVTKMENTGNVILEQLYQS